jgi:hypothetical protein
MDRAEGAAVETPQLAELLADEGVRSAYLGF